MKYLNTSNNMFYDTPQEGFIPYDDVYMNDIYARARNGEVIDVDTITLPSFISRESMQSALWTAELIYLQNNGGSAERISELQNLIAPPQEEIDIEDINNIEV